MLLLEVKITIQEHKMLSHSSGKYAFIFTMAPWICFDVSGLYLIMFGVIILEVPDLGTFIGMFCDQSKSGIRAA